MWRVGGFGKFLIAAAIDLVLFGLALLLGAPILYALIGLGIVGFMEYVVATM